jgi:hypothetical protein
MNSTDFCGSDEDGIRALLLKEITNCTLVPQIEILARPCEYRFIPPTPQLSDERGTDQAVVAGNEHAGRG